MDLTSEEERQHKKTGRTGSADLSLGDSTNGIPRSKSSTELGHLSPAEHWFTPATALHLGCSVSFLVRAQSTMVFLLHRHAASTTALSGAAFVLKSETLLPILCPFPVSVHTCTPKRSPQHLQYLNGISMLMTLKYTFAIHTFPLTSHSHFMWLYHVCNPGFYLLSQPPFS